MSSGFLASIPPVTKNIIIINILLWLASIVLPRVGIDLVDYLGLHFPGAADFWAFQLITYMFMHASTTHLFFNMFGVYMFGRILENIWGAKRFLLYYIVTGVGAAIVQELTWLHHVSTFASAHGMSISEIITHDSTLNNFITVGASGAVFGILLAFGMLFPNSPLFIMFIPIPVKAKYMMIGYGVIELFMGVVNLSGDPVAHFAHLGGMLFGFVMLRYWKRKGTLNGRYY